MSQFELIKVPQMKGDNYHYHFIDEETEAQPDVSDFAQGLAARGWGNRVGTGLGFWKFL